jgi:hypothetical protein
MKPRGSKKATQFTESVIREMTRLAQEHDAVNLSQGFPDFAAHQRIKDAACEGRNITNIRAFLYRRSFQDRTKQWSWLNHHQATDGKDERAYRSKN